MSNLPAEVSLDAGALGASPVPATSRSPLRSVTVFMFRRYLDRQLADGVRVDASPELALRARQLSGAAERRRQAGFICGVLADYAEPPRDPRDPAVPARREVVGASRDRLVALAGLIEDAPSVGACGMARARIVFTDGAGALFNPSSPESFGVKLAWIEEGFALA